MSGLLNVASSPHIRAKVDTQKIMLCVIIALLPATVFGIINFGPRALLLVVVSIASCMASEWVYEKIVHKKSTVADLSSVVTGLLLALNLPHTLPWWMAVLGGVFAIVVVKMLFGGLGQNFMNPALGARCFLLISFTGPMTSFAYKNVYDGVAGATPLQLVKDGGLTALNEAGYNLMDLFTGNCAGTIGETSVICLLIGAIFLIATGVIDLRIPGSYIIAFAVFIILFGGHLTTGDLGQFVVAEICGGGLILGAFFMATDYVTSPITPRGRIIYGILCGILLGIFRMFGASAEGCSYSIIFANLLVPLIEKITVPKPFGKGGEK